MKLVAEKSTSKLDGSGKVEYRVFVDDSCVIYIQLTGNNVATPVPGNHSKLLFKVSRYADMRNSSAALGPLVGVAYPGGAPIRSTDRNDPGFLKAALRDLLP